MQPEISSNVRLAKAVKVMGSGTLISRILGLVRLTLIGALLGMSTPKADIFWTANLIPNSLLLLLAGGVLNTVLVPQITRAIHQNEDGGEAYVNRLLTAFGIATGVLTVFLTLIAPLITWVYSSSQWHTAKLAQHYAGMVALAYLCVPQLFFYGMFFLLGQVLNAKDDFAPMNWAPILNNVISILVFVLYYFLWGIGNTSSPFSSGQIWLLGLGSTIGIIAQLVVLLPFMKRTGYHFRPRFDLRGVGLGHTAKVAKWTIYYVFVSQLTLIVTMRLANSATAGKQGAGSLVYSSAEMLWLLPHSLITVSLATAMLTSASRLASASDFVGVAKETERTVKFAVIFLVPASVGLIALALPIVRLLFGYGAGSSGTGFIVTTLIAFSIGLVPYTIQFICIRAFYALEDTRTAFFQMLMILSLNAILAIIFIVPFNIPSLVAPSLALAVTISYLFGVISTTRKLKIRLPAFDFSKLLIFTLKLFIAAIPAGVLTWFISNVILKTLHGFIGNLLACLTGILAFIPVYLIIVRLLGIHEINAAVVQLIRRTATVIPTAKQTTVVPANEILSPPVDELSVAELPDEIVDTIQRPPLPLNDTDSIRPIVESRQILNQRYILRDRLIRRGDTDTWLAFDKVLSRLVIVHLLPCDPIRVAKVIQAARRGAAATESRFLRILDAVETMDSDLPIGGYVVCEYAPGQGLEELLTHEPLTPVEAGWIARELADALAVMHAQGLYHERLSLDTVIITASGNVKIIGFGVEAALIPPPENEPSWSHREAADVRALGKILYATLVARWPGGDTCGLRSAPLDQHGDYLTPRQVRAGVAPTLDMICRQILSLNLNRGEQTLRTMNDISASLTVVLGPVDASSDLEHRLRYPTVADPKETTAALPVAEKQSVHTQVKMVATDEADFPSEPLTIRPPSSSRQQPAQNSSPRWWLAVILILVLALTLTIAFGLFHPHKKTILPSPSPTPVRVLKVVSGRDFDPSPGDNTENPEQVSLAFDGDPATAWSTERYRKSAKMSGLKPGVGILLDLGSSQAVSSVKLTLTGAPTELELRVPANGQPNVVLKSWVPIRKATATTTSIELRPTSSITTRYLLIWLTSLPKASDNRFVGTINEIQVLG